MSTIRLSTTNARAWDQFPADGPAAEVPPLLAESWNRARTAGVDPDLRGDPGAVVMPEGLDRRRRSTTMARVVAEVEALLVAGTPELEPDARLAVADADGVILAIFGGGDFGRRADAVGFRPGRRWTEAERGTNGIGTALQVGETVVVRSAAHVERQLHQLASVGVTLRGPEADVVAVLGLLLPRDMVGQRPGRPLRIAGRAVERMLAAGEGGDAWSPLPATLERLLACSDVAALLFESPGLIRAASPLGHALLERLRSCPNPSSDAQGITAETVLGLGWAALTEYAAEPGAEPLPVRLEPDEAPHGMHLEAILRPDGSVRAVLGLLDRPRPRRAATHLRDVSVRTIVGSDAAFVAAKRTAEQFARTSLPVLLVAETGAGKEVLARAIHDSSPRATGPFVAINCGSLSPQLLESELFGYGPGAFTGARPEGHDGKIKAAEGGSLFLDEVAEMPPALQSSLLRVLEDGSYYRVGETILRRADIRIICATWRDLPTLIAEDRFRQDLYYRIKGACITIPPLRRRTDISDIVNFLLDKLCFEMKLPQARLTKEAMALVKAFPWPGNIRELRSAVHHALVLGEGRRMLHAEHLPAEVRDYAGAAVDPYTPIPGTSRSLAGVPVPFAPGAEGRAAPTAPAASVPAPAPPPAWSHVEIGAGGPPRPWEPPSDDRTGMGGAIRPLRPAVLPARPASPVTVLDAAPPVDRLEDVQLCTLQRVLLETGGNVSETARRLGIARSTLYRLLERHNLRDQPS